MSASFPSPVLTIDTSTPTLVTGVVHTLADGTVAATENTVENTRAHNELLMPTVFELLESTGTKLSELAAVVVGCGPGPFSGLRVGMATASGLGHALGLPVYGVCSHDAIAWRALHATDTLDAAGATTGEPSGNVLVATDARLVSVADFAAVPQPLTPLYLRRPDAKEPAAKPVSAALRWAEN